MSAPGLTLTAYAQRRGVSCMAVSKAVKKGRLSKSVIRDEQGRPWVVDPELADREWVGATDMSKAPTYMREWQEPSRGGRPPKGASTGSAPGGRAPEAPGGNEGPSLAEATAAKNHWQAELARLKYQREAGELVPAAEVRGQLEKVFRACVTKLLAVPSRAKQALPHLSPADLAELERLQREALEELASGADG